MATGRSRKKNKFKFNERSSSSVRDRYSNDPAFTEDVRHLALPLRRNSGPSESEEFIRMFGKKKSKSKEENSSSLRMERKKKIAQTNNHSAEYLCKNTSSSESLDNIISSYKLKGRKGFSLDRSFEIDAKPQMKPKRSSWFLRDKNRDKQSKSEKFLKRSSLDFTMTFDTKQNTTSNNNSNTNSNEKPRAKAKTIYRQNALPDNTGDSSTTPQEEVPEPMKKLSKFQIGKRFLKGEIGIRSFNYYLLKEGLKKNSNSKQKQEKPAYMSKSEENIYEEIFFHHDQPTPPKPQLPPALPPLNKQSSSLSVSSLHLKLQNDDGNCMNCEICIQEKQQQQQQQHALCSSQSCDKCLESHHHQQQQQQQKKLMTNSLSGSEGYAKVTRKLDNATIYDFFQQQTQGQTVLQFQSYNPNNPNIYKIETTPVAFDYNPIEEQIYQQQQQQIYVRAAIGTSATAATTHQQQHFSGDGKIMSTAKSSSSSDSIKGQQRQQQQVNEFYTRPNYFYPSHSSNNNNNNNNKEQSHSIYKTDSSNSLRSENSLNKIYNSSKNSSQKSNHNLNVTNNNNNNNNGNRDETHIRQDMSDSSLGDSLFSSDANKRYFGSSESCRFNYECGRRRCSLENEKCSFSDTCRYECNLRNCDCSSSYFSSDFDDTNIYNTTNNNTNNNNRSIKSHHQQQQIVDLEYYADPKSTATTIHYAEDFIKHVNNVKRRSQNIAHDGQLISVQQSIYEVPKANPKRLDIDSIRNNNLVELSEVHKSHTGYYITTNDDEMTIAIKESSLSSNGSGGQLLAHHDNLKVIGAKVHGKATGTLPKSSISSNESKRSSTRSSQKSHGSKKETNRNQANDNENSLKLSPGNENLLSSSFKAAHTTTTNVSPSSSASKIAAACVMPSSTASAAAVVEQKKPNTVKANENDCQKANISKNEQQQKQQQQQQPKIAIEDDDDDEVFLDNKKQEKSSTDEKKVFAEKQKAAEIKINEGKKSQIPIESAAATAVVFSSKNNSPYKSPLKALENQHIEALKADAMSNNKTMEPADAKNNNKNNDVVNDDDDDDDSVFINENKQKKTKKNDETSSKQKSNADSNVSSLKTSSNAASSSNSKLVVSQNHNSRESNVQSDTAVSNRDKKQQQQQQQLKVDEKSHGIKKKDDLHKSIKQSNDSSDQLDFNNIPLPDIPTKRNKHLNKGKSLSKDSVLPTSTAAKIQSKWKQLTEKEYFKKMHYRNSSFEKKPTYLFGENASKQQQQQSKDGIFLNRSGWLTTSSQRLEKEAESRKENINRLKKANSKIEELISRSEARRTNQHISSAKDDNVTILKIDPQSDARQQQQQQQILNDRPAYLPVKTNMSREGPPPPTPILSPPPAFQDHQIRNRIFEIKNGTRIQLSVTDDSDNKTPTPIGKGMVFSRSFEYDNRKTSEFNENFSRSFDFDFQLGDKGINKNFLSRFSNSTAFSNLTGVSPNYLTKKENVKPDVPLNVSSNNIISSGGSSNNSNVGAASLALSVSNNNNTTTIFPKVIPGNKVKMNPNYYNSLDDALTSRRPQYGRTTGMNNYRSLETGSSLSKRLNSCDSGARSDFSNDDLDDDEEEEEEDEQSSSLALSYKSAATTSYLEPMKNNRNVTKTLLNQQQQQQQQQQSSFKKTRSMTPDTSIDDYDLLTVDRNNKRQRSLTPEKRPITPELLFKGSKLATSQTSLMSRQSSNNSRNSTLERQLKRYEEGRLSRSSSSSSEVDNNNRSRQHSRPPFKTTFGDYRIRRSRSLQLSERSPNRSSLLQKLVVRIGNTATPQQATTKYREKAAAAADYTHARSKTTLNMPSSKYGPQSLRNSDNSLPSSSSQAKSFEMLDFNGKLSVDYGFESDSKSKSFDDDFCYNTKLTRIANSNSNNNGGSTRNVFSGNRAFSQDRVLLIPPVAGASISKSLRNSPRNYGSRLYDHDVLYDVTQRNVAANRSPLLNFRVPLNPPLSRERSPVGGRRRDREYKKHSNNNNNSSSNNNNNNNNYLKPRQTTTPNRSPNRSPSDSDDSINENVNKVLKDKSLVAEYLFGLKRKQQTNRAANQSGSSSGSCTSSSSCEFWPQASANNNSNSNTNSGGKKRSTTVDKNNINGSNKINVNSGNNFDSDSSGNNAKLSVNTQKQRQQAFRSRSGGGSTTIKVNGGNGTSTASSSTASTLKANKINNSSIIFLGDCEMPITKSGGGEHKNSGNSDSSANKNTAVSTAADKSKFTQKIQITSNSGGELKQQFAASSQQIRAQNYTKGKFFTPSFSSCGGASIKRRHFTRLQSRSLPRSFMRRSRNLSSDTNELLSMFPPHSPLQMRAVSSPSLTESPIEVQTSSSTSPKFSNKPEPNDHISNHTELNERGHQTASSGVLQKFKKTFSHFKNGKQTATIVGDEQQSDAKHHRFGPLVWRTSKERRKTKTHRRDKCNSGDSGIQVELENDENLSENIPSQQMEISPQLNNNNNKNAKVRRANSAKVTPTTIKASRNGSKNSAKSKRSLSQPSDLDVIVCENKMMNNLDDIKHIDDDDEEDESADDTDSLSSNHVDEIDEHQREVVYAEVLYQFQAGGQQELSLEKGALVEVIKRESGPWWWGRIKYDAVIDDGENESHQGWFPKDFVKVIPTYGNRKIIHQQSSNDCDINATLPPSSAAPTISSSQSSSEIMRDNVIKELLETEINYVKLLNSLVNGFIKEMKEHPEVFSLESIFLMFSNIEQIYRFQQNFLEAIRIAIPNGRIAEVFLDFQSAFMVYSQYCNSYPRALMELENFNNHKEAAAIFESCRISQNLPELPLSAHLLAPIQRICRYPLHLSELVKHSKTRKEILLKLDVHQLSKQDLETIDCKEIFDVALNAMKRVTEMVNEGKRHSEYLSRIQSRFENFQGPSINIHSTRLFLQTDAIRVSPNLWNNTYTLFLFDRQLVYCKKDLLKRTSYIYKGRIFLDNCRILNLPDGRMFGVNLKNALRIFCEARGKWFDFCFRSSSSKTRFLNTLSAERQFCGSNLFVSEIASGLDDDNLSDDANALGHEYDERAIDVENSQLQALIGNVSTESPMKQQKFSDSLPKKSRKLSKEAPSQIIIDYNPTASSSNGNRRRLGNWFRKSKSTNSTPSQSPTHHPLVSTATVPSIVNHSDSNSSSQSSPINYPRQKFKEGASASVSGSS